MSLADLPEEVLLHIISASALLPTRDRLCLLSSCKRLYTLAVTIPIWSVLSVHLGSIAQGASFVRWLSHPWLRQQRREESPVALPRGREPRHMLQSLGVSIDINGGPISISGHYTAYTPRLLGLLAGALAGCPLAALRCTFQPYPASIPRSLVLDGVLAVLPSLRVLHISAMDVWVNDSFSALTALQELYISGYESVRLDRSCLPPVVQQLTILGARSLEFTIQDIAGSSCAGELQELCLSGEHFGPMEDVLGRMLGGHISEGSFQEDKFGFLELREPPSDILSGIVSRQLQDSDEPRRPGPKGLRTSGLESLTALTHLALYSEGLTKAPPQLVALVGLRELSLAYNGTLGMQQPSYQGAPDSGSSRGKLAPLTALPMLTKLDLSGCNYLELPAELPDSLKALTVWDNRQLNLLDLSLLNLPFLEQLALDLHVAVCCATVLSHLDSLRHLALRWRSETYYGRWDSPGLAALLRTLTLLPRLERVTGASQLLQLVRKHPKEFGGLVAEARRRGLFFSIESATDGQDVDLRYVSRAYNDVDELEELMDRSCPPPCSASCALSPFLDGFPSYPLLPESAFPKTGTWTSFDKDLFQLLDEELKSPARAQSATGYCLANDESLEEERGCWCERVCGGAVRASGDNPPAETAAKAFDGNPQTKWLAFNFHFREAGSWLEYRLLPDQEPVILTSYALTSANDHPERDPVHILLHAQLEGPLPGSTGAGSSIAGSSGSAQAVASRGWVSHDDDWVKVDDRLLEFSGRHERLELTVAKEVAARRFRLDVVKTAANANAVQLACLDLYCKRPQAVERTDRMETAL